MLAAKQITKRQDLDAVRPALPPADALTALHVYNSMSGEIDYTQLPFLLVMHDVEDVDALNGYLLAIRRTINEHEAKRRESLSHKQY